MDWFYYLWDWLVIVTPSFVAGMWFATLGMGKRVDLLEQKNHDRYGVEAD